MKKYFHVLLIALCTCISQLAAQNYNVQLRATVDFPGQTLANVWGYTQNGREYALTAASAGLAIVEITNPDAPLLVVQIPGPSYGIKEIKTYGHFAYAASQSGVGLQVIDLSGLPGADLNHYYYTGDGVIAGQLDGCHTLHVDTTLGFLYLYGGNLFNGGATVYDLKPNPYQPVYVGKFDALDYIHDGYVDNDTLYACHIYSGFFSIVDMHDKSNPQLLGTAVTPGSFTHNSWLTTDHKHLLTTDESNGPFLTAFDISIPSDIHKLDQTGNALLAQPDSAIVHNTHILNDWALTSWYADGITIVDAHRPENLVQVGRYDTDTTYATPDFKGCWGVYPFFPSGNMVASNMPGLSPGDQPGRLFVLTPTYVRACYLEGNVINTCTNQPLKDVLIRIDSSEPLAYAMTGNTGAYKTGQSTPGAFPVTVTKAGFASQTLPVVMTPGAVTELNINLEPNPAFSFTGTVVDAQTGEPLQHVTVSMQSDLETHTAQTGTTGAFSLFCGLGSSYTIRARGSWGYYPGKLILTDSEPVVISLQRGYYDDFATDYGWMNTGTSGPGKWVRGVPAAVFVTAPQSDIATDDNARCYLTGNGNLNANLDDVDAGNVILKSPAMRLADYGAAKLSFWYWFHNSGGNGAPNDHFRVQASNGLETVTVFEDNTSASEWRFSGEIVLSNFLQLNNQVQVHFIAEDLNPDHIVEAGVDIFQVLPDDFVGTNGAISTLSNFEVFPNPSASSFSIRYDWPGSQEMTLEVQNALGQTVLIQQIENATGTVHCGETWPAGFYLIRLRNAQARSQVIKIVKQ